MYLSGGYVHDDELINAGVILFELTGIKILFRETQTSSEKAKSQDEHLTDVQRERSILNLTTHKVCSTWIQSLIM
jgi:hypothetical protein